MDNVIGILSAIAIVGGWMVAILGLAINATRHVTQINSNLQALKEADEQIAKSIHDFSQRICNLEIWASRKDRRFQRSKKNDL